MSETETEQQWADNVKLEFEVEQALADAEEGICAFLEKRPPAYPDTVSENMPDFYPWWDEPGYE